MLSSSAAHHQQQTVPSPPQMSRTASLSSREMALASPPPHHHKRMVAPVPHVATSASGLPPLLGRSFGLSLAPLVTDALSPPSPSPSSGRLGMDFLTTRAASALDDATLQQRQALHSVRMQTAALREAVHGGLYPPLSTQRHRRRSSEMAPSSSSSSSSASATSPRIACDSARNTHLLPSLLSFARSTSALGLRTNASPSASPNGRSGATWNLTPRTLRIKSPPTRGDRSVSGSSECSSTGSASERTPVASRFAISLQLCDGDSDFTLDRAQSYVVREHTVVVGGYRINQNGLFASSSPPYGEYSEEEEDEEEGAELDDLYDTESDRSRRGNTEGLCDETPFDTANATAEMIQLIAPLDESLDSTDSATRRSSSSSRRGSMRASRRASLVSAIAPAPVAQAMSLSRDDLVELEVIGRGQNGCVRKAVHLPSLTRVALKSMDVHARSARHQLLHELHAYSGLHSPHLIRLLGAYHDPETGTICLASEYMDCGSLTHCMRRHGGRITDESVLKHISRQLLLGLEYLHRNHRLHRDVKPDNLLLNRRGDVKIGDCGLMVKLDATRPFTSEFVGTLAYLSPERLSSGEYSYPSDVWALGVSMVYAATGHLPVCAGSFWEFRASLEQSPPSLARTIDEIQSGKRQPATTTPDAASPEADTSSPQSALMVDESEYAPPPSTGEPLVFTDAFHDFIARMLEMDPETRGTAEELLQHPFLAAADQAASTSTTPTASAHPFWAHEIVLQQNSRDCDLVLEILARRRLLKLAQAEAQRTHGSSSAIVAAAEAAALPTQSPGYAADSAVYMMHGSTASPVTVSTGTPSPPASNDHHHLLGLFSHHALKLSTAPISPPNTPANQAAVDSSRSCGSTSASGGPTISPPSSSASRGGLSSFSSARSSSLFSPDARSCFAGAQQGQGVGVDLSSSFSPFFGSPSAPNTSFASPTPDPPRCDSAMSSVTPHRLSDALHMTRSASVRSSTPSQLSQQSVFVLPAAPAMRQAQSSIISPSVASGSSSSGRNRMSPPLFGQGSETVEILAVVRRLESVRARALAYQYVRPVEEVHRRYLEVQSLLFDQLEEAQLQRESTAPTPSPSPELARARLHHPSSSRHHAVKARDFDVPASPLSCSSPTRPHSDEHGAESKALASFLQATSNLAALEHA